MYEGKFTPKTIKLIEEEIAQFAKTIHAGEKMLGEIIEGKKSPLTPLPKGGKISGKEVFKLYDTYGFPVELTTEMATEHGLTVDMDGFGTEMKKAQEQSRQ